MDHRILDVISSPADLKLLTNEELSILAREIREEIVSVTSETGGHVGSSLGAVEIILAVHSMLDCPRDRFIFDVGHQAYAHKLVTAASPASRSPARAPTTCIPRAMPPTRFRWRSAWRRHATSRAATTRW